MPAAETSIEINAPIDRIWSIMVDVQNYTAWNPFIVKVEIDTPNLRVGTHMKLQIRWADGSGDTSDEVVTQLYPSKTSGARFCYRFNGWLSWFRLIRAERIQTLEQSSDRSIRYYTQESYYGLLAFTVPLKKVQNGFERQARALKDQAERVQG